MGRGSGNQNHSTPTVDGRKAPAENAASFAGRSAASGQNAMRPEAHAAPGRTATSRQRSQSARFAPPSSFSRPTSQSSTVSTANGSTESRFACAPP